MGIWRLCLLQAAWGRGENEFPPREFSGAAAREFASPRVPEGPHCFIHCLLPLFLTIYYRLNGVPQKVH